MVRDNKPQGFFYLDHRTVDGLCNIITDVHVTAGNVHDAVQYLARLDRQKKRFNFAVEHAGVDAGYFTAAVCHGLETRGIYAVMGYRRPTHIAGYFYKREYQYDAAADHYTCPQGQRLLYATTSREGYRHYKSNPQACRDCPVKARCTKNAQYTKTLTRHVWEDSKERVNGCRLTEVGKALYARGKETVECSFVDAKQLHGYRYAQFRGRSKVQAQCLMTAAAQNIQKIALVEWRKRRICLLLTPLSPPDDVPLCRNSYTRNKGVLRPAKFSWPSNDKPSKNTGDWGLSAALTISKCFTVPFFCCNGGRLPCTERQVFYDWNTRRAKLACSGNKDFFQ